MKKYFTIITLLIFLLSSKSIFAEWEENCETKKWFELYNCRVPKLCSDYKSEKPVIKTTEYYEASEKYWIDEAKGTFRTNMNNIYSCWMLKSQKKSYETIKKLVRNEKSWKLANKVLKKIDYKLKSIDESFQKLQCKNVWKKDVYNKIVVLKQTTYELCKYSNYVEYLRDYYSYLPNIRPNKESFWVDELIDIKEHIEDEINDELEHNFKVFPIVFNAYSEYENNFPIHVLLELIRDDLITFRDKFYQTISPINQVAYKISNAMSIH